MVKNPTGLSKPVASLDAVIIPGNHLILEIIEDARKKRFTHTREAIKVSPHTPFFILTFGGPEGHLAVYHVCVEVGCHFMVEGS